MDTRLEAVEATASHDRHIAAGPPRRMSTGTRLAILVALSVATVVSALTLTGLSFAERQLNNDLRETAQVTAVALADEIELRQPPLTSEALLPLLRDFMGAAADLKTISVYSEDNDAAAPLVSVPEGAIAPAALVQQAMTSGESTWSTNLPHLAMVVTPVRPDGHISGAVAVAVSLSAVEQLRRVAGVFAVTGAAIAIVSLTLLIHVVTRRLVLEPLNQIRSVIARARMGDLEARAEIGHNSEMKEVADGLNAMLTELDDLHRSLNERVANATDELRQRNEQLVRSYESVVELREAVARAQQLATIGQTAATVAHQIGTPLNVVSGHVQLLSQEITDAGLRRRLTIVEEQLERVASVVRDLLERARPPSDTTVVSVASLINRLADAIRPRASAARVALEIRVDAAVPAVIANETQLEFALLNLTTNALDAMVGTDGTLTLTAAPCPAGACIQVRDTGGGISPDIQARLFEPWVTTKPAGRGAGLGLSITRSVVTRMGGDIRVENNPGQGATFVVELPAQKKNGLPS